MLLLLKGNTQQVPQADQSLYLLGFPLPYFQFVKRFTFSNCPNTFGIFISATRVALFQFGTHADQIVFSLYQ